MNLDLRKKLDLSKNVVLNLAKNKGIVGPSRVVLCLDFSGSMQPLYDSGKVQEVLERIVPVAMAFDDNGEMELYIFHDKSYRHSNDVTVDNIEGIVKRELIKKYMYGGTEYAPPINDIIKEAKSNSMMTESGGGLFRKSTKTYKADTPTYVIFITDGDNSDKDKAENMIKEAARTPVFFQFVGIGRANFNFLNELDNMPGRYIDNANFFQVNDITNLSDEELYERLLNEYPSWLKEAKIKGLLT